MTCVLYDCNTEICSWASWFNKKSSSIPHKNLLTVVLAAPQGVTLSSNVAMVNCKNIISRNIRRCCATITQIMNLWSDTKLYFVRIDNNCDWSGPIWEEWH